ncbi:MAG: methylmalonyl-CoA epimerase [Anaerolineae bacterium]|nr:methylmalonyl-CoA epimerase [Anaerolineae bacterium]
MRIKKINHIAIAVGNLDESMHFWHNVLGLQLNHIETVDEQKSKVAFFPVGDSEVELVMPTESGTGLAKFIDTKGGGMHHLCFEVDDLEDALHELADQGIQLINREPVVLPGRKMAFIHPKSTGGVLVELYELLAAA